MNEARWFQRIGPWLGIATGPGVYILGGELAARFQTGSLILVMVLGVGLQVSLIVINSMIHRRGRQRLVPYAAVLFEGGAGNWLLNSLMALSLIGWFSFYMGISGFGLATLLSLPGWLGSLLLGVTMLLLNFMSIRRWNALVWVTTLAALASAIIALLVVPATPPPGVETAVSLGTLGWGFGAIISYSVVFAVRCGDFTHELADDWEVIKTGLAFSVPLLFGIGVGVLLYRRTGDANLAQLLATSPSAWLGNIFLVLAAVSPSLTNIYSGSLNVQALFKLPLWLTAIIIAVIGIGLGALRFDLQLVLFLDWLGTFLPPLLMVMITPFYLKQPPNVTQNLAAWLLGAGVAIGLKLLNSPLYLLSGMLVTAVYLFTMQSWSARGGLR